MAFKDPQSGSSLDKGQFKKLEGKRLGQTKIYTKSRRIMGSNVPAGYYVKAGHLFKYNWDDRDARIESKYCIPPGQPGWRGDPCPKGVKEPMIGSASQLRKKPRMRSL